MDAFTERLSAWNKRMNGIPRKLLIIFVVLLCCYIAAQLFPICWPFVLAFVFAAMMEPVARLLRRAFGKLKAARSIATLICMLVFFGLVTALFFMVASRVVHELVGLVRAAPDFIGSAYNDINALIAKLYGEYSHLLPKNFMELSQDFLSGLYTDALNIAKNLSGRVATFTISTATSVPAIILSIVLTVMGTFYLSYDRERITGFFRRAFPANVVKNFRLIRSGVFTALFGQIRAQLFISFVIMLVVIAGLMLQQKPYALLIGIVIGVADALPVIGAGLFLITWAIVSLILGNFGTAAAMLVLYLVVVIVRQTIEPRIVGKQLGLYPLVTMMCMFAGFQLIGALGLLAGPIVANICRVALDADAGTLGGPKQDTPLQIWLNKRRAERLAKKAQSSAKGK